MRAAQYLTLLSASPGSILDACCLQVVGASGCTGHHKHSAAVQILVGRDSVLGILVVAGAQHHDVGACFLRAVGDTRRPLYFLVLTSVINIGLDLLFVLQFHLGIFGVALATIISQFISAGLTLLLLLRTNDIYRLTLRDCRVWH